MIDGNQGEVKNKALYIVIISVLLIACGSDLNKLKKFSRFATNFIFEVSIVQPGLSKTAIFEDIIQLLGSTEDYLLKTSRATLSVLCSK